MAAEIKLNIILICFLLIITACKTENVFLDTVKQETVRVSPTSITDINTVELEQEIQAAGYTVLPVPMRLFETIKGKWEFIVSVAGNDEKPSYARALDILKIMHTFYDVEFYEVIIPDVNSKKILKFVEDQKRLERILNGEIPADRLHLSSEIPYKE